MAGDDKKRDSYSQYLNDRKYRASNKSTEDFYGFQGRKIIRQDTEGQLNVNSQREHTFTNQAGDIKLHTLNPEEFLFHKGGVTYFWKQILFYDHERMIRWTSLRFFWGTILQDTGLWIKLLSLFTISAISALGVYFLYTHEDLQTMKTDYMEEIMNQFNALTSFLLSFYLNEVIKRWWTVRDGCIGVLWKSINNLCQIASTHLGPSKEHRQCKALILRYGLLSHALVYKQAQSTDNQLQDLLEIDLLNKEELVILKNLDHKAQIVWVWMTSFFQYLIFDTGSIPKELVKNIHDQLFAGRNSIQRAFSYIDTQVPLPYAHLNALTVHLFHIILAVVCGISMMAALFEKEGSNFGKLFLQLILITAFGLLYQGILIISGKLQNPLGHDDIDFPRMAYHMALQETGEAFFLAAENNAALTERLTQ